MEKFKIILLSLLVSIGSSMATAVVCLAVLAPVSLGTVPTAKDTPKDSIGNSSAQNRNAQGKSANPSDPMAGAFSTGDLVNLTQRVLDLEKEQQDQLQKILDLSDRTLVAERNTQGKDSLQGTDSGDFDSNAIADEADLMALELTASASFDEKDSLFELEEYDEFATSQLQLSLDDMKTRSEQFGISGLSVLDQECRGESCRVTLNWAGDGQQLKLLPTLLATQSRKNITVKVMPNDSGNDQNGQEIIALLN